MLNIGAIGCGYWGPNLVRNLAKNPSCSLKWLCDINPVKLKKVHANYHNAGMTRHYGDILKDRDTDAVIIATPLSTHYEIARDSLMAGKHVFVEKPFVESSKKAEGLINLARKKKLVLMAGYTFVYSPAIQKIKEIVSSGGLGSIHYIHSTRVNLGIFRHKESVVWDLASHDFSVIFYWFKELPYSISCTGKDCLKRDYIDTAHITVSFKSGPIIYILVSWLAPIKMRNMIITGSKKMVFFNDERLLEKIKIFDEGAAVKPFNGNGQSQMVYKVGSVLSPCIDNAEPLEKETFHFVECIIKRKRPITDGESALKVIKAIEAAEKSLKNQGKAILYK